MAVIFFRKQLTLNSTFQRTLHKAVFFNRARKLAPNQTCYGKAQLCNEICNSKVSKRHPAVRFEGSIHFIDLAKLDKFSAMPGLVIS